MKKVFAILLVLVMVSVLLPSQDVNAYTNSDKCPDCDTGYLNCVGSNDTQHSFQCTNVDCEHHGGNRSIWEKHWGGDATCTDKTKCRACGAEYGELADHSWAWVTDKEPTCGEPGEKHEECSVCHATQNERYLVIPATGKHTFEWVTDKEPTCIEAGEKHEECSVCHDKRNEGTEIPAKGHTVVTDKGKAATCTKAGLTAGKHCSVCGQVLKKQKKVNAKGHLYQDWEPAEEGKHRAACARCGHGTVGDCVVVAVPQADPNAAPINLCPVCGHREGGDLVPMTDARAKGGTGDLAAFMTEAGEEERLLTVSFQRDGKLQQPKGTVALTLPAAVVEGYDLFLIGPDGTESSVATKASSGGVTFTVPFTDGGPVCFLRLSPKA